MVTRCAILLLWITIGISGCNPAVAQDCFYEQQVQYKNGETITAFQRYDCTNSPPPKVIVVEKEAEPKTLGDWLFRLEENDSLSHVLEVLVSGGVL